MIVFFLGVAAKVQDFGWYWESYHWFNILVYIILYA